MSVYYSSFEPGIALLSLIITLIVVSIGLWISYAIIKSAVFNGMKKFSTWQAEQQPPVAPRPNPEP